MQKGGTNCLKAVSFAKYYIARSKLVNFFSKHFPIDSSDFNRFFYFSPLIPQTFEISTIIN